MATPNHVLRLIIPVVSMLFGCHEITTAPESPDVPTDSDIAPDQPVDIEGEASPVDGELGPVICQAESCPAGLGQPCTPEIGCMADWVCDSGTGRCAIDLGDPCEPGGVDFCRTAHSCQGQICLAVYATECAQPVDCAACLRCEGTCVIDFACPCAPGEEACPSGHPCPASGLCPDSCKECCDNCCGEPEDDPCPDGYLCDEVDCRVALGQACTTQEDCASSHVCCAADGCVDQENDPFNCGGCGIECGEGESCLDGACACEGGPVKAAGEGEICNEIAEICCPGSGCRSLDSDVLHCGDCGRACDNTNVLVSICSAGACNSSCEIGFGNCSRPTVADGNDDGCEINLYDDPDNCGRCGRLCSEANADERLCTAPGICNSTCTGNAGNCYQPTTAEGDDDGCEVNDLSLDALHCGGCERACLVDAVDPSIIAPPTCIGGRCRHRCFSDGSTIVAEDCDRPQAGCTGAECAQPPVGSPFTPDDGCEVDNLLTDINHCGECSRPCDDTRVETLMCNGGVCTSTCIFDVFGASANCLKPTNGEDDGCEVMDIESDELHCGGCGRPCSTENVPEGLLNCENAFCEPLACNAGFADCTNPLAPADDDGCESTGCEEALCFGRTGCQSETGFCRDQFDNDVLAGSASDGVDCVDPDCASDTYCELTGEISCDDDFDNDGDGSSDCEDTSCEAASGLKVESCACNDGLDNDDGGDPDCEDEDCALDDACGLGTNEACDVNTDCAGVQCECQDAPCTSLVCTDGTDCAPCEYWNGVACIGDIADGEDDADDSCAAGTCTTGGDCSDGSSCAENADCDSGECECADAVCGAFVCTDGSDCGRCEYWDGGTCTGNVVADLDDADDSCGLGGTCDDGGTCTNGSDCTINADCTHVCLNTICADQSDVGGPCDEDADCTAGNRCTGDGGSTCEAE